MAVNDLGDGTVESITVEEAALRWAGGDNQRCEQEFAGTAMTSGQRKRLILEWEPKRGESGFEKHLALELRRMVLENENGCLKPEQKHS